MLKRIKNIRNVSYEEVYDKYKITVSPKHKGFLLSSSLVDKLQLSVKDFFKIYIKSSENMIYFEKIEKNESYDPNDVLSPSKAGGTTREGRPRLLIRATKLLAVMPGNNRETYTKIAMIYEINNKLSFCFEYE